MSTDKSKKNMDHQLDQLESLSGNLNGLSSLFKQEAEDSKKLYEKISSLLNKVRYRRDNNRILPKEDRASQEDVDLAIKRIEELLKR